MAKADNPAFEQGQSPRMRLPDSVPLLIVGGGIMGLWAAVKAERLGIGTLLVEAGRLGGGASGGLLGALMPHMPDRWSDKKQFQFDALVALEAEIAGLEAETGLSGGYRRCGRIIPLPKPHLRGIAERHERDAAENWRSGERRFQWHVGERPSVAGWVDDAAGEAGFVFDTLAARVSPRALIALLSAFLRKARHVQVAEGCRVVSLDADAGRAALSSGEEISFGHVVVANGHESFPLIRDALGLEAGVALGQAVKGQAALLDASADPAMPVVFLNGLYIVPHEDGTVAIGSTSEDCFSEPFSTDEKLEKLLVDACTVVPSLAGAPVLERWAGLRPKAVGRDPMVGAMAGTAKLVALSGGFKVSFGLAHFLADAALETVCGHTPVIPSGFRLQEHVSIAVPDFRKF
ncbi:NAD(P)/FAD-dependent oxidoreductase [Agrobacterium fabrum]|nr:FAD-binding oxidoreductase [Agrobacterium fabrum]KEY56064.1 D-amino acid oxidase [Agrobacterium tumefaciens]MCX2877618.1 FAD-binding oxidoreductase [Agrobacterium fabrum]NMV71066.1 FAD-binding oxidoreductase [Agrobacterium fabrum]QQN05008.1 FAD-binding oxidoreductase [Agrobacterium fabrum]QQN10070.1 FAD-binding oxidoreductase [Agrobacterium fabrum]